MTSSDDTFDDVAQLRAADPAADVDVPEGFAQRVLDSAQAARPVDFAAERSRRRPGAAWLAAGAAAALIGLGGFGAGTLVARHGEAPPAVALPPLGDYAEGQAQDSMLAMGRFSFTADALGQQGANLPVYSFEPSPMDAARAAEIAGLLGVEGPLTEDEYGWGRYGDKMEDVSFGVSTSPYTSVFFWDPQASPQTHCYFSNQPIDEVQSEYAVPEQQSGGGDWERAQRDIDRCLQEAMASAPSGEDAAARLAELMTRLGIDLTGYQITGRDQNDIYEEGASAFAGVVVGGYVTDVGFRLSLTDRGVVTFDGTLGSPVNLGDYPVISEQQAFDRLSDPRFGPTMGGTGPWPYAVNAQTAEDSAAVPQSGGTGEPQSGGPQSGEAVANEGAQNASPALGAHPLISWPVQSVHIVSAELVYSSQWNPDESVLLVPYYSLTDTEGRTWTVIAVADEALDFTWTE